jgi:Ran GTPase-activating protein (RanGAP) involved in mRNA processing and transport
VAAVLKHTSTIEVLSLRANNIGVDGLRAISDALVFNTTTNLELLSLGDNRITEEGMEILLICSTLNRTLKGIGVYGHGMDEKQAKKFWKKASKTTNCVFDNHAP